MLALILIIFILGYLMIAFEHTLHINKAASALITGVLCWTVFVFLQDVGIIQQLDAILKTNLFEELSHEHNGNQHEMWLGFIGHELGHHLAEIAQILFFLLGAMTIVELVDIHGGFSVITDRIKTRNKVKLLWMIAFLAFFLSSVLDNLTTAIVMVSLLSKIVEDRNTRLYYAGVVVIAANAGGAWSPIGDVTTTMLWIDKQVTTGSLISHLFIPSLVSVVVPLMVLSFTMKGRLQENSISTTNEHYATTFERNFIFFLGVGGLIFVPFFKIFTHLPPYMGMMLSLGTLWIVTELLHKKKKDKFREQLSASHALERIDIPSVLFFLGILLAVSVLQSSGMLASLAHMLDANGVDQRIVVTGTGILSAVVDNVPLVKAAQGMYPLSEIGTDSSFWQYMAYCAGTGGSILIIGSAAGVATMGLTNINFFWYLKKFGPLALLGYLAGAAAYLLMFPWHNYQ